MASRQEQKEQRRREREAAEKAAAAAGSRNKRIQLALAAFLGVAVIVGVVIVVTSGGGGGGGKSSDGTGPTSGKSTGAKLPPVRTRDLATAAKAAGCIVQSPRIEGSSHVTTPVKYGTNPPTSGNHNPEPALDGVYDPGNTPAPEHYVHALEHGRIEIQYKKGTPAARISQLETLANEPLNGKDTYKVLMFENNTNMPYDVAATAWGQLIGCKTFNDKDFDAIRAFRLKYVDKGPEIIPPNN